MPTILIIGARRGLGRALADVYHERGWSVRSVNRDTCDLSDPDAVARLSGSLASAAEPLDVCAFAAGYSEAGHADDLDDGALRRCFEVNFFAPVALFRAAATAPAPCRRFVFVLSGAADLLVPGLSPYALSKRALRDYLYVVKLEGSFRQCRVLVVWPGPMATDFDANVRVHGPYRLPSRARARPPRDVAERIYAAERSGQERLVLSWAPAILGRVQSIAPALARWLIARHARFRPAPR